MSSFPSVIDLTTFVAEGYGFVIQGDAANDVAGWRVSSAGDVNGDGIDDSIVGAPYGDDGGTNAGEAYVIFGKAGATRTNIDLTSLAAADGFIIQGDMPGDIAARSVAAAGDVNGDGFGDIVIGASRGDDGGYNAGEAYLIFGKSGFSRTRIDLTNLSQSDGFIVVGDAAYDRAGWSVSGLGDVNQDGIDDFIVSQPDNSRDGLRVGESIVIYGKIGATRSNIDLTSLAAADGFIISGDTFDDQSGRSVSEAGDINGDGIDDILVGAPIGDNGGVDAGEAYVIFGKAGATRASINLTNLPANVGFVIQGDAAGEKFGWSLSSAGDINGDGLGDIIAGAIYGDNGGIRAGEAYVIFGKVGSTRANIDLTTLSAADGFIIQGDTAGDNAGYSVSGAGDVNGDGIDDLIIGAHLGDNGGTDAGEAYVIFGKVGATRTNLDLTSLATGDGFTIQGDAIGDHAGFNVSSAGDINGDGIGDLVIGAPSSDKGGTDSGAAYVIFGRVDSLLPSTIDDNLTGTEGDDSIDLLAGDDTYSGLGGNDTITGGEGADDLSGNAGNDVFIATASQLVSGDSINGGADNDTLRLTGGGPFSFFNVALTSVEHVVFADAGGMVFYSDSVTQLAVINDLLNLGVTDVTWTEGGASNVATRISGGPNDGGTQVVATDAGGNSWTTSTLIFDANGIVSKHTVNDDGTVVHWAYASAILDSITTSNLAGERDTVTIDYDVFGRWRSHTTSYDGDPVRSTVLNYDVAQQRVESRIETASSGFVTTTNFNASSQRASIISDDSVSNIHAWESSTLTLDPATGQVTQKVTLMDDGNTVTEDYSGGLLSLRVTTDGGANDAFTTVTQNYLAGVFTYQSNINDNGTGLIIGSAAGTTISQNNAINDAIFGNGGADVFTFNVGMGQDRIFDFANGVDLLDPTALNIGAVADIAGNGGTVVQSGADLVITLGTDTLTLKNFQIANLDDGDFVGFNNF